ncbi:DUF2059 domain-containing protein [Magnetococcus sp. PR-3]|uniref:DUF2059 domain-containing protein n=1 Tax=Magnetococcus sp. PR-3 TaxID=3120355 RepID=UPI002FCE1862
MLKHLLCAALLTITFHGQAWAQPVDPQAHKEAVSLIKRMDMSNVMDQMVTLMLRSIGPMMSHSLQSEIQKQYPKTPEALIQEISTDMIQALEDAFSSVKPEMLSEFANVYAKEFTASELKSMNQFFASPAGQQFIKKQGKLMQEGQKVGQEVAKRSLESKIPQIMQRMDEKFKDRLESYQ